MPKRCPKCNSQTDDTVNFCPQCGQQFIGQSIDPTRQPANPAWIVAMQEKIKDARYGEIVCLLCAAIGFVLTALIVIPHIVLRKQWETLEWVAAIGFLILFVVGGIKRDSFKSQKEKLIDKLEQGKETDLGS